MTADELKTLLSNIDAELNGVADFAGALDPALLPFIAIGKAVGKQVPGLVAGVAEWVAGNKPTDQDKADLASKLSLLSDPNAP